MKTLNTLLTLSLLVIGSASFAKADDETADRKSNVPAAPSVWESSAIETPEFLIYLKAKNAHVPVAEFVWGNPAEEPSTITMVPQAPFTLGDPADEAPQELEYIKAKFSLVPLAPFVWGDVSEEIAVQ